MYWLIQLPPTLSTLKQSDNGYVSTATDPLKHDENDLFPPNREQSSKHVSYNPMNESGMSVIIGPRHNRSQYYVALCIMFLTGSGSDFLAKLVYQFLPSDISPLIFYWFAWLLTISAFFICIFAIYKGRESFKLLNINYFLRICIPALCDVFVSGGRYIALVFLPASIVSILKNGLQLVFLAMIRTCLSQYITKWQIAGIAILWIGLLLCMLQDILQINDPSTFWGMLLMFFVGLFGAIRNSIEEFLLKKENFHPDFILGLEGIISFIIMLIIGVIFLFTTINIDQFDFIPNKVYIFFGLYPGSIICVIIFMFVLVTKKSTQFHVTKMSSAMTRKLFQQFYPIGVWFMVLFSYYLINHNFGEKWSSYQWMRCLGILLVLLGTFVYLKPEYFQRIYYKYTRNIANV